MLPRPKVEVMRLRPTSLPSKRNAARKGQGIWRVASTVGPGPIHIWTRSNNNPWTWSTIYSLHTNRSHYRWTWSNTQNRTTAKNTLDQVQQHLGPGPIHIWTRSNNNPWTRSTIYSLQATGSHYRWTRSNTQNRTTTKNTLDQVQQHLGPGPTTPRTRSNTHLDEVQ